MNSVFGFRFDGDDQSPIGARSVKFVTETGHNHTYKFCMKYCLQVNNYKYGDGANL